MGTLSEPLRKPDGSLNKAAIYNLQKDDLKAWIDKRLSGDDPYLPLGRSEELPHTLLLQLFQAADPVDPFRERLHQVTRELLEPVLAGRAVVPSPEWLGEVLRLAFGIRTTVARAVIREAFESGRFREGPYEEAGTDIELLDLLAIQEGLEPIDFWMRLIRHPRYALPAFIALERYGRDAVIQALPHLIATLRSTTELEGLESKLALPLKRVVERFDIEHLRPLLEARVPYPDQLLIAGALRLVGIPLDIERPKSVTVPLTREQIQSAILDPEQRSVYGKMVLPNTPIRRGDGRDHLNRTH